MSVSRMKRPSGCSQTGIQPRTDAWMELNLRAPLLNSKCVWMVSPLRHPILQHTSILSETARVLSTTFYHRIDIFLHASERFPWNTSSSKELSNLVCLYYRRKEKSSELMVSFYIFTLQCSQMDIMNFYQTHRILHKDRKKQVDSL